MLYFTIFKTFFHPLKQMSEASRRLTLSFLMECVSDLAPKKVGLQKKKRREEMIICSTDFAHQTSNHFP